MNKIARTESCRVIPEYSDAAGRVAGECKWLAAE